MKCKNFVELYKGFMKDLPWPVCIQEVNGNILYINEVFENIFHISYEKIISKNFYEDLKIGVLKEFDDRAKDKKLTANKIKIEGSIYDIYRIPLKDNDDVYAICDIFIDITEKVNKEDQLSMQTSLLRTMVDSLPEIVFFKAADILKEICGEYIFRWGGDEFIVLLPNFDESKCEDIIRDIQKRCKEVKHDYIQVNIALGNIVKKSIDEDIYECIKNVEKKVYSQKLVENKSVKDSIINSLKKNLENKSYETSEHANRVANYAIEIGKRLNFRVSEMDELIDSAQLHDIGKIAIDEYILKKPSKLTDEEYEIIKTHCENGYRIINASSGLETVAKCVLSHHERWDGNGYPFGLTGEEIPLISRIISVADSYDVMTSNRPYNKPLKHEEAMKELERCAGSQFDPNIVREFKLLVENNALLDINI